jgi:hypothetical protein
MVDEQTRIINEEYQFREIQSKTLLSQRNESIESSGYNKIPMNVIRSTPGDNLMMKLWNCIFKGFKNG